MTCKYKLKKNILFMFLKCSLEIDRKKGLSQSCSPMAGTATMICLIMDTPARKLCCHHLVILPMSLYQASIESPACLSDGYSAPIKVLLFQFTCRPIWRSLLLDSTDVHPVAAGYSFVDFWNRLSLLQLLARPTLLTDMIGRVFSMYN
jgi:hypothetical protein